MKNPKRRWLFDLQHPDCQQAAWIRADGIENAARTLFAKTAIPVVVHTGYGWWLCQSQEDQHSKDEKPPMPHWKLITGVGGAADLIAMPEHVRELRKKPTPQRDSQVTIGPSCARFMPLELNAIPSNNVVETTISHNQGPIREKKTRASLVMGYTERNCPPVTVGEDALLFLDDSVIPEPGDVVRILVKAERQEHDYIVTGMIKAAMVSLEVLFIETGNCLEAIQPSIAQQLREIAARRKHDDD